MTSHEHSSRKLTNSDNDKRRQAIDKLEQKQVELMKEIIQLKKTEAKLEEVCQNMSHSSSCLHRQIFNRSQSESFGLVKRTGPGSIYDRFQTSYTSADWRGTTSGLKFSSVEEKTSDVKPSSVVDISSGDKSSSAVGMTTGRIINPQSNSWRGFEFIPVQQVLSHPQQTSLSANAKGKQKLERANSEKIMSRSQYEDADTIETDGSFPQNKFTRKILSTETIKNKLKHSDSIFAAYKPINQPHLDKGLNIQSNLNTGSDIKSYIVFNSQSKLMGGLRAELRRAEDPVAGSRKVKKQEQMNSYAGFSQQDDPTTWQPRCKVFIANQSASVTGILKKEKVVPESLKTTEEVSKPKARLPSIEDVLQVIEQESRDGRPGSSRLQSELDEMERIKHINEIKAGLMGSDGRVSHSGEVRKLGYPGGGKNNLRAGVLDVDDVYDGEKPAPMEMNFECEIIDPSLFEVAPVDTHVEVSPVDTPVFSSVEVSHVISPEYVPPFRSPEELSVTCSLTNTAKPTDKHMESSCHESQTINETVVNDHTLKGMKTNTIKSSENNEKVLCTRKDYAKTGDNEDGYFGFQQKQNPDSLVRKPDLKSPIVSSTVGKNLIISRDVQGNNRSARAACSSSCIPDNDEKYSGICSHDNAGKSNSLGVCSHHNCGKPDGSGMCPFDMTCMKKQINDVSGD